MDEERDAGKAVRRKPVHKRIHVWAIALALLILIGGLILLLGLTERVLPAPAWVVARVEARANDVLKGEGRAKVGGLELFVDENFVPHVRMTEVDLFSRKGRRIAHLPSVRSTLDAGAVLHGRLQPRTISITGAEIALTRNLDGTLDFSLGEGTAEEPTPAIDPVVAVDAFDRAFTLPVLRDIDTIEIDDLSIAFTDRREIGRAHV